MRYFLPILFFLCSGATAPAQTSTLKGIVYDHNSHPLEGISVLLPRLKLLVNTAADGSFDIPGIPYGNHSLILQYDAESVDTLLISVSQPVTDLERLTVHITLPVPESAPEEEDYRVDEEGAGIKNNISGLLRSSGDVFHNAANFNWSVYGFRQRAYTPASRLVLINGIVMNDLLTGNPSWNLWSGLNDAFRNAVHTYGLAMAEQTPGAINGSTAYDITATVQSPQTRISWALSDRAFNNRLTLCHSSGLNTKGWAWSAAASGRWASESYIPGTSMAAYSLFFALSKVVNTRHEWHLSSFAAYTLRSRSAAATDELYRLSGTHYYNPNWGWQNGLKRNARYSQVFQPVLILSHQYTPSEKCMINTVVALQTGLQSNAALDWYKAADPRPDYYRNLPSYFTTTDPGTAAAIDEAITADPGKLQLNWDRLYQVNRNNPETLSDAGGISGNTVSGNRSAYVIGADRERILKYSFSTLCRYKATNTLQLYAGLNFSRQRSTCYRQLEDLLGGDYFLNYNQFAEQQYTGSKYYLQQDLDAPDRAIRKGDRYRYAYISHVQQAALWTQAEYNGRKFSAFLTLQASHNSYAREGLYRNALFAGDSYGRSKTHGFTGYSAKAGITYKINGRNYLFLHGLYASEDQGFAQIFIAPRMRNQALSQVGMCATQSAEGGYMIRSPKLDLLIQGYVTRRENSSSIQRFYNDDPDYQGFVNFVLSGVNQQYTGIELGTEYRISPAFACNAAAALGQAYYTNRPSVSIYSENDTNTQPGSTDVYIQHYYLGAGPQTALMAGISITGNRFWYARLSCNYFNRNYIAVNPARRTAAAAELLPKTDPAYERIFGQEVLPAIYSLDLNAGKSLRLKKLFRSLPPQLTLYLNLGINNLLDRKDMKTGGYEQLRYDFAANNPDKFPSKYFYGYGRTFLFSMSLKM